nr:MAG TPA: hypothetical protein [Inoviridae sp.]
MVTGQKEPSLSGLAKKTINLYDKGGVVMSFSHKQPFLFFFKKEKRQKEKKCCRERGGGRSSKNEGESSEGESSEGESES